MPAPDLHYVAVFHQFGECPFDRDLAYLIPIDFISVRCSFFWSSQKSQRLLGKPPSLLIKMMEILRVMMIHCDFPCDACLELRPAIQRMVQRMGVFFKMKYPYIYVILNYTYSWRLDCQWIHSDILMWSKNLLGDKHAGRKHWIMGWVFKNLAYFKNRDNDDWWVYKRRV